MSETRSHTQPKRLAFAQGKDAILTRYARTLGAFQETLESYVDEYDDGPFDHEDEVIPEVFKHYFQLIGMRQVIQDLQTLDAIHEEIAGDNDYPEWEC